MELPPKRVEEFLHQRIPLSKAFNCKIVENTNKHVVLSIPKFANTVEDNLFSDLASISLGKLATWTLMYVSLQRLDYKPQMSLERSDWKKTRETSITATTLTATCSLPKDKEWQQFLRMLSRKAQAIVSVSAILTDDAGEIGTLSCEYNTRDLDHM